MTKTKNLLNYILTSSIFSTCLYFGVYLGIPGFMNVITFYIWFVFVVFAIASLNEEGAIKAYEIEKTRFKLGPISYVISAAYIGVLVFYGHILLASIYLITNLIGYVMVQNGKKLVAEQ